MLLRHPLRGPLSQVRLWSQLDVTRLNDFQHLQPTTSHAHASMQASNPAAPLAHLACQFHIINTHASRTCTAPIATAQAPAAVHSHLRKDALKALPHNRPFAAISRSSSSYKSSPTSCCVSHLLPMLMIPENAPTALQGPPRPAPGQQHMTHGGALAVSNQRPRAAIARRRAAPPLTLRPQAPLLEGS